MEREHPTKQETFKKFISGWPLTWASRLLGASLLVALSYYIDPLEESIKKIVKGKDNTNTLELSLNCDKGGVYTFRTKGITWIVECERLISMEPARGIPNNTNNNFGCGAFSMAHICLPERRELVQEPS